MTVARDGVRLAELVAALSLATDLGLGQPQQHIIRQTLIAMRVADLEGLSDQDRAAIFYVSLLAWVGCVVDAHEMGKWFGDDTAVRSDSYLVDLAGLAMMRFMIGHMASGSSSIRRLTMIGRFFAGGRGKSSSRWPPIAGPRVICRCDSASALEVRDRLQQAFERWDGKGFPTKLAGEEIARIMRIVHVANDVEALERIGGMETVVEMLRARRGTKIDQELVDRFCAHAGELLASIDEVDGWETLIGGLDRWNASSLVRSSIRHWRRSLTTRMSSRRSDSDVRGGLRTLLLRQPVRWASRMRTLRSYGELHWCTTLGPSACPSGSWTSPVR